MNKLSKPVLKSVRRAADESFVRKFKPHPMAEPKEYAPQYRQYRNRFTNKWAAMYGDKPPKQR